MLPCYRLKRAESQLLVQLQGRPTKGSVRFRVCGEGWCEGVTVRVRLICTALTDNPAVNLGRTNARGHGKDHVNRSKLPIKDAVIRRKDGKYHEEVTE